MEIITEHNCSLSFLNKLIWKAICTGFQSLQSPDLYFPSSTGILIATKFFICNQILCYPPPSEQRISLVSDRLKFILTILYYWVRFVLMQWFMMFLHLCRLVRVQKLLRITFREWGLETSWWWREGRIDMNAYMKSWCLPSAFVGHHYEQYVAAHSSKNWRPDGAKREREHLDCGVAAA
jgi:hypothetical protein